MEISGGAPAQQFGIQLGAVASPSLDGPLRVEILPSSVPPDPGDPSPGGPPPPSVDDNGGRVSCHALPRARIPYALERGGGRAQGC